MTITIEGVRGKFPKELDELLVFQDEGNYIIINRKAFLDRPDFDAICGIVRDLGGEYVKLSKPNEGILSHWKVPKQQQSKSIQDMYARWAEIERLVAEGSAAINQALFLIKEAKK